MSGSKTFAQTGVYGTQGTAAASNQPGARNSSITLTDASGNLWLMGGVGYDVNGNEDLLNDLWKYNVATGLWTWVSGSNTVAQSGVYGTKGTSTASNQPGARQNSISWSDASGNLWLMGGVGYDVNRDLDLLNDLWKYNVATGLWTWVSGSNTSAQSGVYGTQGTAAASNSPGARYNSISWADASGNLWLMGGVGYDVNRGLDLLNDLWKYNTTTGQWTWVSGDSIINQKGVYGTQGTAAAANKLGARYLSATWTDASGNLWLMGGYGYAASGRFALLNDLWKYSLPVKNNIWTGATSTDWNDAGNWSVGVPTSTIGAIIPAAPINQPLISNTGTASADSVVIENGAILTNNGTLNMYGNFANSGSFASGSGSSVVLKKTGTLSGTDTFANLEVIGAYTIGTATSDKVFITEKLIKSNHTLITNDKLTLLSTATGSAMIDDEGGSLTGKAYVQHFTSGAFGYHHFSSPISDGIVGMWGNRAFPLDGPDGAPAWSSQRGTLQYYDEINNGYSVLDSGYYNYTNPSNTLVVGQGYTARLNSLPTLNSFGTPNNGPLSIPVTHSAGSNDPKGWNLVGNPYPSPISWTALRALNSDLFASDDACYLWKASGKGIDGIWSTYDGTVGVNGAGDVINSSLGFFVYVDKSGTLKFDNSVRTYDFLSPEIFGSKSATTNTLRLSIKDELAGTTDEAVAYTNYKAGYSRKIAQPEGATNATIAFEVEGKKAAINKLTSIDSKTELPITISTPKAGTYTLAINTKNINLPVYLKDAVTGTYTDLSVATTITTTAKETAGRYSLVFKQPTVYRLPLTVYPNPSKNNIIVNGSHIASVQVVDNLGKVVKVVSLKDAMNPTLSLSGLATGAYRLKIQTTDGKVSTVGMVKE